MPLIGVVWLMCFGDQTLTITNRLWLLDNFYFYRSLISKLGIKFSIYGIRNLNFEDYGTSIRFQRLGKDRSTDEPTSVLVLM